MRWIFPQPGQMHSIADLQDFLPLALRSYSSSASSSGTLLFFRATSGSSVFILNLHNQVAEVEVRHFFIDGNEFLARPKCLIGVNLNERKENT